MGLGTRLFDRLRGVVRTGAGGPPRHEAVRLRSEVVRLYARGLNAEAAEAAGRLVAWQRAALGEHHPDYALGLFNLALLRQKQGDAPGAAALADRVVALRLASPGSHHPETAAAETLLAALRGAADPSPPGDDPRTLALLDRVASLEHVGPSEPAELEACRAHARRLRAALGAGESDVTESERLARGEHPFAALLALVERRDGLSDAEWADLHEAVCAAFGPPLARAASRGRLAARVAPD